MHVGAKKIATAGLCVAFSVVMMMLSTVIESSSLFFIAAASFSVGIAVREWGLRLGVAFLIATVGLNFLITPSKLYCFTLAGMGFYIWMNELLWKLIADAKALRNRMIVWWVGKYIVFNILYIPAVFLTPQILFKGEIDDLLVIGIILAGQVALFLYDTAYRYFQAQIWGKLRRKVLKEI